MKPILSKEHIAIIEAAARAMAKYTGWYNWDTATDFCHTPSGIDPEEERQYWRDIAEIAYGIYASAGQAAMAAADLAASRRFAQAIVYEQDHACCETCVFCGGDQNTHEPVHRADCAYVEAVSFLAQKY